jgi:hypothetical protein
MKETTAWGLVNFCATRMRFNGLQTATADHPFSKIFELEVPLGGQLLSFLPRIGPLHDEATMLFTGTQMYGAGKGIGHLKRDENNCVHANDTK